MHACAIILRETLKLNHIKTNIVMDIVHIDDDKNIHNMNKYIIGVMALQGAVEEHMNSIRKLGATAIEVQKKIVILTTSSILFEAIW